MMLSLELSLLPVEFLSDRFCNDKYLGDSFTNKYLFKKKTHNTSNLFISNFLHAINQMVIITR